MNNLEKLSSGDIATRNNGTFEQFQEVIGHCFPNDTPRAGGEMEFYEASDSPNGGWVGFNLRKGSTINKPIFDITQLWEELQALKKPEIWWIRVTHQNVETIAKWFGSEIGYEDAIVGCYKHKNGNCVHKGCIPITGVNSYDFGNEIDFATFLKYTGVEVEKVEKGEKCTCETCNPNKPEKVEKSLEDKLGEIDLLREKLKTFNDRIKDNRAKYEQIEQLSNDYLFLKTKTLLQYSDLKRIILVGLNEDHKVFQFKLTEINTQISALLK